jgi:hypothetical protein
LAALVGTAALLSGGCRPSQSHTSRIEARETVGETTIVHVGDPVWPDTAQLVVESILGSLEGRDDLFVHVIALTVAADSHVVTYDNGLRLLREHDARGSLVGTFGRYGQGPGEFRGITGLAALSAGRLLARDPGNLRINVYGPADSLEHWKAPVSRSAYGQFAIQTDRGGSVYLGVNPRLATDGTLQEYPRPTFLRIDISGNPLDTLFIPERYLHQCPIRAEAKYASGFFQDIRERYIPKIKTALSRDGEIIVGCPAEYVFDVWRRDGTVLRVRRDEWEPVAVSREEADNFVDSWTSQIRELQRRTSFAWTTPIPAHKPAYQKLHVGRDGRIWVWIPHASVKGEYTRAGQHRVRWNEGPGSFDVFEPDGTYLGSVRLPSSVPYEPNPRTVEPFFWGDHVWAVAKDTNDVEYVTRFRIVVPRAP